MKKLLLLLTSTATFAATTLTFQWDAPISSPAPVIGYRLYQGTAPGVYTVITPVVTNNFVTINIPDIGTSLYFAVKSVAAYDVESDTYSNEVVFTYSLKPTPPIGTRISNTNYFPTPGQSK